MKYNGSIALERSVVTHKHISTSCLLVGTIGNIVLIHVHTRNIIYMYPRLQKKGKK